MKHFFLSLSFLLAVTTASHAQATVADTHPESTIQTIDYNSGNEVPNTSDAAILFKDAFIELVSHTATAKIAQLGFGHKFWEVQQMDPSTDGNAFQVMFHRQIGNNVSTNYTFVYNVDQNQLSWLNPQTNGYVPVLPQMGPAAKFWDDCANFSKFNLVPPQAPADQAPAMAAAPADSITAPTPPQPLQDEVQPPCPTDGYLWQPGNWTFVGGQYVWAPGVWAAPPTVGFLWTPAYWGYVNGVYLYNAGYWGPTVGFYGGLNFGYGYAGEGFAGGRWEGGNFRYNTAVMRVSVNVHNTYVDRSAYHPVPRNRAAFHGPGGITREPSPRERAELDRHTSEVAKIRAVNRATVRPTVVKPRVGYQPKPGSHLPSSHPKTSMGGGPKVGTPVKSLPKKKS